MSEIDLNEFEEYLKVKSSRKYFIMVDTAYGFEKIEFFKKLYNTYPKSEFSNCIEPRNANCKKFEIKKYYLLEVGCEQCGYSTWLEATKTDLINVLSGIYNEPCKDCKIINNALNEIESVKIIEERKQEIENNKIKYIKLYLNPSYAWNKDTKINQRFNQLNCPWGCDWEQFAEHIKNMGYYEFLKTPYWIAVSQKVKLKANFMCQLCSSKEGLQTHHRNYDSHGYEHMNLQDLIVLCSNCHGKFHDKL